MPNAMKVLIPPLLTVRIPIAGSCLRSLICDLVADGCRSSLREAHPLGLLQQPRAFGVVTGITKLALTSKISFAVAQSGLWPILAPASWEHLLRLLALLHAVVQN